MRVIAVGVIQNEQGEILLCKKSPRRGVFPGQWGLPGDQLSAQAIDPSGQVIDQFTLSSGK
jgi:ADP-ribose pyrophosphatase YjhB (NUDIX family)